MLGANEDQMFAAELAVLGNMFERANTPAEAQVQASADTVHNLTTMWTSGVGMASNLLESARVSFTPPPLLVVKPPSKYGNIVTGLQVVFLFALPGLLYTDMVMNIFSLMHCGMNRRLAADYRSNTDLCNTGDLRFLQHRVLLFAVTMLMAYKFSGHTKARWFIIGLVWLSLLVNVGIALPVLCFLYAEANKHALWIHSNPAALRCFLMTHFTAYASDIVFKVLNTGWIKKHNKPELVHLAFLTEMSSTYMVMYAIMQNVLKTFVFELCICLYVVVTGVGYLDP